MATNASKLLQGYQVPLSTTQTFTGPMPGAYGMSPLQAIAAMGTLFATPKGGENAVKGFLDFIKGFKGQLPDLPDFGGWL
jgi:hypothetical protein